jgi:hypothetical protein
MSNQPINWEFIPRRTWETKSNAELAERYQCSRQNVAHHRARLGMPASPETPGGDRITGEGSGRDKTTAVINCTKGQKRRWLQARDKAGTQTWDAWAARVLDEKAAEILDD